MSKVTTKDLAAALARIEEQLGALALRVERLEGRGGAAEAPAPPPAAPPATAGLAEEELLAVSAALAAFLGVRVRIRQIRLVSSAAWAQQGRVSIQASHQLHS